VQDLVELFVYFTQMNAEKEFDVGSGFTTISGL